MTVKIACVCLSLTPSFRRRPESSGVISHSRRAGMAFLSPTSLQVWIPAFAGMTMQREQVVCHPDSPYIIPDKCLAAAFVVIPVQAGIQ